MKEDKAVAWLLDSKNPSIRYWTLKDLLGEPENEYEVVQAREQIASWTPAAEYLNEQHSEGFWGSREDVYWPKWTATVWPLILIGRDWSLRITSVDPEWLRVFLEGHGCTRSVVACAEIS